MKKAGEKSCVIAAVCAAITHDGKTPLVFVEAGVKIDQYVYREMLQDHLIPWAEEHFGEEYWCFQ